MNLQEQTFELWRYQVDVEATLEAYASIDHGDAENCGCGDCLNWIIYRQSVIPLHVQKWLTSLGVDVSKEIEVSEYEGGYTNLYMGQYLFSGKILYGPEPYVPTIDGNGASIDLVEVYPSFKLGLSASTKFGAPVPKSFESSPVVQVLFQVRTPPTNADS